MRNEKKRWGRYWRVVLSVAQTVGQYRQVLCCGHILVLASEPRRMVMVQ
jgi:hypothetical protein